MRQIFDCNKNFNVGKLVNIETQKSANVQGDQYILIEGGVQDAIWTWLMNLAIADIRCDGG